MRKLISFILISIALAAYHPACAQTSFNAKDLDIKAEVQKIQKQEALNKKKQERSRQRYTEKQRRKKLKLISDSTSYANYMIELSEVMAYGEQKWPDFQVYKNLKEAKKAYREPYFAGGYTRVRQNIRHNFRQPESLMQVFNIGQWGYVILKFMVDTNGKITRAKIINGIDPDIDEKLELAILGLPQLYPGEFGGKKYPSIGTIAIEYEIVRPSPEYWKYMKDNGLIREGLQRYYMLLSDYNISWCPAITPMIL